MEYITLKECKKGQEALMGLIIMGIVLFVMLFVMLSFGHTDETAAQTFTP